MAQSAYDKALYLLSGREHTEKELRNKLLLKGYSSPDVDDAVLRLKKENALSEERFAEVYIRSRLRKSAEGKTLLRVRLLEKGTPRSVADAALDEAWERGDYREPLKEDLKSYHKRKGKDYAFSKMMQKGFSLREIQECWEEEDE